MERVNTLPYAQYVHEVNRIWGTPLLREPQLFHTHMVHGQTWHPRLGRKTTRKDSISLSEILGQEWQGRDDEDSSTWSRTANEQDANVLSELKKRFDREAEAIKSNGDFKT